MRAFALSGPVLGCLALLVPGLGAAQVTAGAGVTAVSYTLDDPAAAGLEEVTLLHVPVGFEVPLAAGFVLQIDGAWATATARSPAGGEATRSGPTDTRVRLAAALPGGLALAVTGLVSSGSDARSAAEATVEGLVASELLAFPMGAWGSGGGFGGELGASLPLGSAELGVVAGYRASGSYEPLSGEDFTYRPGDEASLRLVLDAPVGSGGVLTFSAAARRYGDDQISDRNLFRSGDRIEGSMSLTLPAGLRSAVQLWGGVLHRSAGVLRFDAESLEGAGDQPSRRLLLGGVGLRTPLAGAVLVPSLEGRLLRTSDGAGEGWIASTGLDVEVPLSRTLAGDRLVLVPGARARLGDLTGAGTEGSRIRGWEAGVVLRWEPPIR